MMLLPAEQCSLYELVNFNYFGLICFGRQKMFKDLVVTDLTQLACFPKIFLFHSNDK